MGVFWRKGGFLVQEAEMYRDGCAHAADGAAHASMRGIVPTPVTKGRSHFSVSPCDSPPPWNITATLL